MLLFTLMSHIHLNIGGWFKLFKLVIFYQMPVVHQHQRQPKKITQNHLFFTRSSLRNYPHHTSYFILSYTLIFPLNQYPHYSHILSNPTHHPTFTEHKISHQNRLLNLYIFKHHKNLYYNPSLLHHKYYLYRSDILALYIFQPTNN